MTKDDKLEILNLLDAVESDTLVGSERIRIAKILRAIYANSHIRETLEAEVDKES